MEEETLSKTHHPSTSVPAASPSPSPSQDPNNPSAPSYSAAADIPTVASAASKIPLRPRKVRKLSSSDPPAPPPPPPAPPPPRVLPRPLTAAGELSAALLYLRSSDPHLVRAIDAHPAPSLQSLPPPFHSLTRSILYQQLAYKAAASIYSRFLSLCGGESLVLPHVVLSLTPQQLRQIGVSGRKAAYLHDLASKFETGILSDSSIVSMDDKSLFSMLTMVKGIGAWSVHMFMIFSLHRPDVLPVGDLGVRKGVQILYGLEDVPRPSQMEHLCKRWRPYRSVGAWYMWRLVETKGSSGPAAVVDGDAQLQMQQQQQERHFADQLSLPHIRLGDGS